MKNLLRATLLIASVGACGDTETLLPPPPPPPGAPVIQVSVSTNAILQRGASTQVTVTVLRQYIPNGPIDLGITGLGTGLSAFFAPASVPEGSSTSTLTLRADSTAATGTFFATLGAQAPGVGGASVRLLVSVTP